MTYLLPITSYLLPTPSRSSENQRREYFQF